MGDKFDFSIDEMKLDREWLGQAESYFRFASKLANAKRSYDEADNDVKVLKAELELAIRSNPSQYGLDKVTEGVVAAAVLVQPEYKKSMEELRDHRHAVDIFSAAVEAMQHRKRALEKLVDLQLSNYYAAPVASKENREAVDEMNKATTRRRIGVKRKDDDA